MQSFSLAIYALACSVVFMDFVDFALRLYRRRVRRAWPHRTCDLPTSTFLDVEGFNPHQRKLHLRPYALAISVHQLDGAELDDFLTAMEPHRDRLYVIDDASTDGTPERLEAAGLRVIRGDHNRHKPGAIRELLGHLPEEVESILVMDPDSRILELAGGDISALDTVVFDFQRSGHAALCPRIAVRSDGWLTHLQRLEYALAFSLGRKSLGDRSITSGIALYRRQTLERALEDHSLSVYAEDLENTLHLISRDERIYYDERLVVETEGKSRIGDWFSQRVGWSFGLAKVYAQNGGEVWRASRGEPMHFYQFFVYLMLFSMVFHPLKLLSLVPLCGSALNGLDLLAGTHVVPDTALTHVWYFPLIYAKYTLLIALALHFSVPRSERRELAPFAWAYLPYALAHLVPVTVGYLNWLCLRVAGRRVYRDHFADDAHAHG